MTSKTPNLSKIKETLQLAEKIKAEKAFNKLYEFFPDDGPQSRENYPRHVDFFKAGAKFNERAFSGGNQVGKTLSGSVETTFHLMGEYPDWWEGKRFDKGISALVVGKTKQQLRDSVQEKLLGKTTEIGTGIIPKSKIKDIVYHQGAGRHVDHVVVEGKHGDSYLYFMTHDQGRETFQGRVLDWIWFDEEPPSDVYSEGITRTISVKGLTILTFTPLNGLSDVALSFFPDGRVPKFMEQRYVIQVGWEDVPHLDPDMKKSLMSRYSPHELEARTKGIPIAGSGAIYQVADEDIAVTPFQIPIEWPRAYGFDYGVHRTAAVFMAMDPITNTKYIYDIYTASKKSISDNVVALQKRGAQWMKGASEYFGSDLDGNKFFDQYREYGLNIIKANKAVEAGIAKCTQQLITGKTLVFSTCADWFAEKRLYHRVSEANKSGHFEIVKKFDDLMDAWRYLEMAGDWIFTHHPSYVNEDDPYYDNSYLDKDDVTGY